MKEILNNIKERKPFIFMNPLNEGQFVVILWFNNKYNQQITDLSLDIHNYDKPPIADISSFEYTDKPYIVLNEKKGIFDTIMRVTGNNTEHSILNTLFHELAHLSKYQQNENDKLDYLIYHKKYGKNNSNYFLKNEIHSDICAILSMAKYSTKKDFDLLIEDTIKMRKESDLDYYATYPAIEYIKNNSDLIYSNFKNSNYKEILSFTEKLTDFTINYDFKLLQKKEFKYNLSQTLKKSSNYREILTKFNKSFDLTFKNKNQLKFN